MPDNRPSTSTSWFLALSTASGSLPLVTTGWRVSTTSSIVVGKAVELLISTVPAVVIAQANSRAIMAVYSLCMARFRDCGAKLGETRLL